jgi:hypothetical protein
MSSTEVPQWTQLQRTLLLLLPRQLQTEVQQQQAAHLLQQQHQLGGPHTLQRL